MSIPSDASPHQKDAADDVTGVSDAASRRSVVVTGAGLSATDGAAEAQRIHRENLARLDAMSRDEILTEREALLRQLGNHGDARCSCVSLTTAAASRAIRNRVAKLLT